ncbi:unnamed protein product [Brassica napus]|uniref:(rape) hypothetical protein n=1 Tax=Brassica napus TaxID=3708 RepID=A0A816TTM7_BRANA|nr:unnamed protein product [Brassica napus]
MTATRNIRKAKHKRWGMLSPVAGVVEGDDEKEVVEDELLDRHGGTATSSRQHPGGRVSVITTREREEGCRRLHCRTKRRHQATTSESKRWHCSVKRRHQATTSKSKRRIHIDLNAESHDLNETKLAPATDTDTASEEYPGWPINGQNRSSTLCKFR